MSTFDPLNGQSLCRHHETGPVTGKLFCFVCKATVWSLSETRVEPLVRCDRASCSMASLTSWYAQASRSDAWLGCNETTEHGELRCATGVNAITCRVDDSTKMNANNTKFFMKRIPELILIRNTSIPQRLKICDDFEIQRWVSKFFLSSFPRPTTW